MRRYSFWLIPATVASFLSICWFPTLEPALPEPVAFETTADFRAFVQQHGFLTQSGSLSPEMFHHCYVSREPRNWEYLGSLSKAQCGLTPKWKGVVWATTSFISADRCDGLVISSLGGHYRIWGKVLVAGDEEVLNQLEECYQQERNGT